MHVEKIPRRVTITGKGIYSHRNSKTSTMKKAFITISFIFVLVACAAQNADHNVDSVYVYNMLGEYAATITKNDTLYNEVKYIFTWDMMHFKQYWLDGKPVKVTRETPEIIPAGPKNNFPGASR